MEAAAVEAVITLSKALLDSVGVRPEHLCSLAANSETVVGMGRMSRVLVPPVFLGFWEPLLFWGCPAEASCSRRCGPF